MLLKTVDRVVMELWYRTVWSRTLHNSDEGRVDLKQLKVIPGTDNDNSCKTKTHFALYLHW